MADEMCVLDQGRSCPAEKLEHRVEALERWRDDSKKFHKDFYAWQLQQEKRDSALDEKLSNMEKSLEKLLARQDAADQAPKKRMDGLVDKAVWSVLAAVIAFILARIGL